MNSKSRYNTKQLEELVGYLRTLNGSHVTVGEICEHFRSIGKSIGTTTVYRHLERLIDDGLIKKYVFDGSTCACFEYIGDCCSECHPICFHCKCMKCGKLIHMECDELAAVKNHVFEHHGFRIDLMRTTFFGLCDNCRGDNDEKF